MQQLFLRNTLLMLAAVGMATVPTKAFAHQVQTDYVLNNRFANREDEVLETRTTFSTGEPLKGAKVSVFAPERPFRPYATGVTDDQGRFAFNPDESITGDWEVKIQRAGHADILLVPVTANGIEADLVSMGSGSQDVHYASSPLMAVGGIVVAAACIGFGRMKQAA